MLQIEKQTIVDFLRATDPEMEFNQSELTLTDCVELLMDKINEMELDYSILSNAFVNRVNPSRYEDFYESVMSQYDMVRDGEEIPESVLDRIAAQYR